MEKIDPMDMMQARLYEAELRAIQAEARAKGAEFQAFIDGLFAKHSMIKGADRLEADGTIVRAAKEEKAE